MAMSKVTKEEALKFHSSYKKGKISILPTKPLQTADDLAKAYSPGVGYPCLEIQQNPELAYEYTSKGNFVAVISNGTAVLGFGNIGAMASKPVMEGKSVLMKRFAGVDSIDIEVETTDPKELINIISKIGNTWGGINLEDIKAPDCFQVETELQKILKVPVFHDDQHGTAVVVLAAIINGSQVTGKQFEKLKVVINGAGAAGIACAELMLEFGIAKENLTLCDTSGVIYKGRAEGMNEYKEKYARTDSSRKTLEEATEGADVLIGLSAKGAFTEKMLLKMAPSPMVFALANPDPEITPMDAASARQDVIAATGRSDYQNQINNVMCFPFLFRAALDLRVPQITKAMKIAAAKGIAELAREPVYQELRDMYRDQKLDFGSGYIVPKPYDKRLFSKVVMSVAKVAMESGDNKSSFATLEQYKEYLEVRYKDFMVSQ